jgi:hypothetical protein
MIKLIGGYEVPDSCPMDCPLRPEFMDQGDICCRCPVFNCKKTPDSSIYAVDGYFQLMKPEEYREDWGKEWALFFKTWKDKKEIIEPNLYLWPPEKK